MEQDTKFLALLVHRGYLERKDAEILLPRMKAGGALDDLLMEVLDWPEKEVRKLRRTRAGQSPEIPGFEIIAQLGTGGTADVFRAREKQSGRPMALKILKPACTRNGRTRQAFVAEARMLEQLDHQGLVGGFGIAKSGTTYFSKLELIDGSTLLEIMDRNEAFREEIALRIILEVAEVLRYLSEQHVVHRDVKPGNIMLSSSGRIKLIDLGFAAIQDSAGDPSDQAVGTVAYLSPEQAMGGAAADLRSDIYSLGVTLFHLVVGRLPFESSDDHEVLRMQVMKSLSSPELKGRGFSPHLHYIIEKMMAKDAEVRYQSWAELIEDVRSQLEGRDSLDFESGARRRGARSRGGQSRRR